MAEQKNERVEPIMYLLFVAIVFFTAVLIGVEFVFKDDGQVFQVIASLLTGFSGAFFARMKAASGSKDPQNQITDSVIQAPVIAKETSDGSV